MSPVMTDDRRDVQAVLDGRAGRSDEDGPPDLADAHRAFARIYDRHAAVVRALCRRHSPSDAEADDALQETFIRAYRLLEQVSDSDGLRSWLYAIARNVCSERRRAATRRAHHEHAAAEEERAMTGATGGNHTLATLDGHTRPAASVERAEALARLTTALDDLPDDERLAIHLYYLDPDPVAAAGESLGISRSAFYKLLARARGRLASILGPVTP